MSTLQTYLEAHKRPTNSRDGPRSWLAKPRFGNRKNCRLAYQRWRHAVEQLRDAFERCAGLINKGGGTAIEVQVQPYEVIDQPTWGNLLSGGGAKRTWFFKVWVRKNQKIVWYYFFFGRHFWFQAMRRSAKRVHG